MKKYYLGVDVGGTNIKTGILSEVNIVEQKEYKTVKNSVNAFYSNLKKIIKTYMNKYTIAAMGIGFPSMFDYEKCIILEAPNIPIIKQTSYCKYLDFIDTPFYIDNDANLAAFGEYMFLKKEKKEVFNSFLLLTLGSGLGTGIIIDGKIYHGAKNFIEGGHIIIEPFGKECPCGGKGCIETLVSSEGLLEFYKQLSNKKLNDPYELFLKAESGDKFAIKAFQNFGFYLGIGLTTFYNLLNSDAIIIGGGLSHFSKFFLEKAKDVLKSRSYTYKRFKPFIDTCTLKNSAGFIGAALYARQKSEKK